MRKMHRIRNQNQHSFMCMPKMGGMKMAVMSYIDAITLAMKEEMEGIRRVRAW